MSEYKHLKVEKADGVARITFDRPKHNVLDIEMMNELIAELKGSPMTTEMSGAQWCRPSFCAGVEVSDHKPEMASKMIETFNHVLTDRSARGPGYCFCARRLSGRGHGGCHRL